MDRKQFILLGAAIAGAGNMSGMTTPDLSPEKLFF